MHSKLKEILSVKQTEISSLKEMGLPSTRGSFEKRDFRSAVSRGRGINLIAEIKFASPSAGKIRERADPVAIAAAYERAGAAALSFLTDREFFHGRIEDLPRVKRAVSMPVLRKDFILDEIQVEEAALFGADAVLLIARILSTDRLRELLAYCRKRDLAALTEVHDKTDLEKALDCGADLIGINNRDLDTFEIHMGATFDLAPLVPENCVLVCESGLRDEKDVEGLKGTAVRAVLVGSALMAHGNPEEMARKMAAAGQG